MSNEDLIEERKRSIAIEVIKSLDDLYNLSGESILIQTTHFTNPDYKVITIEDRNGNKIGINIHKLK